MTHFFPSRFGTGIEFRESALLIGPKNTAVAKKGQVYNANLGFSDLSNPEASDSNGKKYALFIGDTVVVNEVRRVACFRKLGYSVFCPVTFVYSVHCHCLAYQKSAIIIYSYLVPVLKFQEKKS